MIRFLAAALITAALAAVMLFDLHYLFVVEPDPLWAQMLLAFAGVTLYFALGVTIGVAYDNAEYDVSNIEYRVTHFKLCLFAWPVVLMFDISCFLVYVSGRIFHKIGDALARYIIKE